MSAMGDVWDEAVGTLNWLKSLAYGEFAEDRPRSVLVVDMLAAIMVPGAVVVMSARDLAAVSLRLGRRYDGVSTDAENAAHPEWQEWVILIASLLGVFGPAICAAVGSFVGFMVGDEAAAVIRAVRLLLIERSGQMLERVVSVLARFTKGDIVRLLAKIRFADYEKPLVRDLVKPLEWTLGKIQHARALLSRLEYFERAKAALAELDRMEKRFYAVQVHCVKEIPQALAKLDEALQKLLKDKLPPTYHPAYAAVPATKPEVVAASKVRVTPGIGGAPKLLPMLRDGAEAAGGGAHSGGELPKSQEAQPESSNVHRKDVEGMTRAEKGGYGEKVSRSYVKCAAQLASVPAWDAGGRRFKAPAIFPGEAVFRTEERENLHRIIVSDEIIRV